MPVSGSNGAGFFVARHSYGYTGEIRGQVTFTNLFDWDNAFESTLVSAASPSPPRRRSLVSVGPSGYALIVVSFDGTLGTSASPLLCF
jgi:hypothetical protein